MSHYEGIFYHSSSTTENRTLKNDSGKKSTLLTEGSGERSHAHTLTWLAVKSAMWSTILNVKSEGD